MGAPRKHPPQGAAETIQRLAATGFAIVGIAKEFNVAKETFKRWLDESEALREAFEAGREIERQALHASVYRSAMEGKPANVNAFFLLKARHGYVETDNRTKANVEVAVQSVMYVTDHGSDDQWAAKAAEQQRKLLIDAGGSLAPPEPSPSHVQTVAPVARAWVSPTPTVAPPPSYAPPAPAIAPAWRGNA